MLAAAATTITLTVRVFDLYGMSPVEREQGIRLAQATLAHAGVASVWIDCTRRPDVEQPARCRAVLAQDEIVLRFQRESPRGAHILGTAVVQEVGPNVFASIYAHTIAERAARTGVPRATILGRVMAHEIGHLLLGTNSHAPHGLMKASWRLRDPHPDVWLFTPKDAEKIRHRVSRPSEPAAEPATVTF